MKKATLISGIVLTICACTQQPQSQTQTQQEPQTQQESKIEPQGETPSVPAQEPKQEKEQTQPLQQEQPQKEQSKQLASSEKEGSAKWVLGSFFNLINNGNYEKSLTLFVKDPVKGGELSLADFKKFADKSLTKQKSITDLSFTEKPDEANPNSVEVTVHISYKDGSTVSKWVIVQNVEGKWKLTTRGSLF